MIKNKYEPIYKQEYCYISLYILYCKLHPSGSSKNKNNLTYIHYKHTISYIELFQQVKRWLSDRRGPYINATDCFKKVQTTGKKVEFWLRRVTEMNFLKWGIMFEVCRKSNFMVSNNSFLFCSFNLQFKRKWHSSSTTLQMLHNLCCRGIFL
jgi:hypothetical protein